jgi:small subunit ribosomal protein S4
VATGRSRTKRTKLSRALGVALTPKAGRHLERRSRRPGEHGHILDRPSDFKVRLKEKQRLRAQYNVGEGTLRRAHARAARGSGQTGEALLAELETRLDALVLRSGLASTIYQARQSVSHGHIRVDDRKVNRPSYRVRPGQAIEVAPASKTKVPFLIAATGEYAAGVPEYLDVDLPGLRARLTRVPRREEIPVVCDERLGVEYYAR